MEDIIKTVLNESSLSAYTFLIAGVLLVIIIQNIFFYFNYKDKAYLWYTLYALAILLDQVSIFYNIYLELKFEKITPFLATFHYSMEWLYNTIYVIFVIEFGDFLTHKKGKKLKKYIYILFVVLLILSLIETILGYQVVRIGFLIFLVPSLIILSIIIYYNLFKMKTPVKYFIIPGSLAFSLFSIAALVTSLAYKNGELSWGLFYIGVFIENIFFSLGLVVKQRIILKQRNQSQHDLILQLKENEQLKSSITKKLQGEVKKQTSEIISLNEQAETEKIKQLEVKFEKEMAELKITSLQSQMNPHFIFNSLNSIKLYIIKNDKENAVYYLNKFSKLIRKILTASREKVVSLSEELETVELYVNIENIRFKNEIDFQLNVEENINLNTIKIPPLILQPFIENAIWHGLSPKKKEEKKLSLSIKKPNPEFIEITITDNGVGRKKSKEIKDKKIHKKQSLGLKLTEERLQSFSKSYINTYSLIVIDLNNREDAIGTQIVLHIPLK